MTPDAQGFLYPLVDEACCTDCGLCQQACPVIDRATGDGVPISHACRAVDEGIRGSSSSGGVFTLVAQKTLDDGGVVFGAALTDDLRVVHEYVETTEGLTRLRGSKYVQSAMGRSYWTVKALLGEGRPVLFSGTPCQVSGLKSYLGGSLSNLLCIDFVCHGVPSPRVWSLYVQFQEKQHGSRIHEVSFRNKAEGWRRYSIRLKFDDGTEYRGMPTLDPYMRAYLGDICLRPSCYACKFKGLSRDSDITLADFWGIERVLPGMDDDRGTSLVLVNSEAGQDVLNAVADGMDCVRVELDSAIKHNPAAVSSAVRHPEHDSFYRNLNRLAFDQLVGKYCSVPIVKRARKVLGRVWRLLRRCRAR